MKSDLAMKPLGSQSSFLSCEKDCETILRKLFIESQPYSDILKRLLVINTKDCLDNTANEEYNKKIKQASLSWLRDNGYVRLVPRIQMPEHEQQKAYILMSFNKFLPNYNTEFRSNMITFEIMCHTDCWDLGNYRLRPLKIAGYIDSILHNSRLSGIGQLKFAGCTPTVLDENVMGYMLVYKAVHGNDDKIQGNE